MVSSFHLTRSAGLVPATREKGENVNGVFLVYRDVLSCHVALLAEAVP